MICNICSVDKGPEAYYGKHFRQCKDCCRAKHVALKANPPQRTEEEMIRIRLEREARWRAAYAKKREEKRSLKEDRKMRGGINKTQELRLQYIYGLKPGEYKALLEQQYKRCAICHKSGKLVVDHDHKTGKVRGLLHSDCNTALGLFKDNPRTVRAAARYLEKNEKASEEHRRSTSSREDTPCSRP